MEITQFTPHAMQEVQHYRAYLAAFVNQLTTVESAKLSISTNENVMVFVQTGRKFDKIVVQTTRSEEVVTRVAFFVEKSTGAIYGKKTDVTPNRNWYFGTVFTVSLWDWSGEYPVPINDPSVELVAKYGSTIKHYRPKVEAPNVPYPETV